LIFLIWQISLLWSWSMQLYSLHICIFPSLLGQNKKKKQENNENRGSSFCFFCQLLGVACLWTSCWFGGREGNRCTASQLCSRNRFRLILTDGKQSRAVNHKLLLLLLTLQELIIRLNCQTKKPNQTLTNPHRSTNRGFFKKKRSKKKNRLLQFFVCVRKCIRRLINCSVLRVLVQTTEMVTRGCLLGDTDYRHRLQTQQSSAEAKDTPSPVWACCRAGRPWPPGSRAPPGPGAWTWWRDGPSETSWRSPPLGEGKRQESVREHKHTRRDGLWSETRAWDLWDRSHDMWNGYMKWVGCKWSLNVDEWIMNDCENINMHNCESEQDVNKMEE